MKWIEALKVWNIAPGQNKNLWKIPKKNTPENAEVKEMMGGKKAKEAQARAEMEEELRVVPPKKKRAIKISEEPEVDLTKEYEEGVLSRARTTAQKAKLKAFLSQALAKKRAKMSKQEAPKTLDEYVAEQKPKAEEAKTKGYYDRLLKAKQLEYERWSNARAKERQELKRAMTSAESEAIREEDKAFTKEINKLKKLRKEAPLDAVDEDDYPRIGSRPPTSIDVKKLYTYFVDKVRQKETRTGKPRPSPIYELVQESPPRFKLAYDRWSGGPYPYQTPSKASYIQREAERKTRLGGEVFYETKVSRGERKGSTIEGSFTELVSYKPSERELNWLRTGKYE